MPSAAHISQDLKNVNFIKFIVLCIARYCKNTYLCIVIPLMATEDGINQSCEDMNTDNAKSQMRKGMLEYCVLLLLRRQPSYANDIINQLKDADLIVVEGTLYPLLTRLKKDGLLSYEWRESIQGPPRKYYALTDEGSTALRSMDETWSALVRTVEKLKIGF